MTEVNVGDEFRSPQLERVQIKSSYEIKIMLVYKKEKSAFYNEQ